MTATPAAGEGPDRPTTFTGWLRARDDRDLVRLFRLRPDLGLPAPADTASLAGRAATRSSVQRAVDGLDAHALRALENLMLAAGAGDDAVPDDPDALEELFDRALIWGDETLVHLVPTVREAVGQYPAGLGRPAAALLRTAPETQLAAALRHHDTDVDGLARLFADADWPGRQLRESDPEEREVLTRLAAGPPVGTVRALVPRAGEEADAPQRLVARGVLLPIGGQRVELPREIGRAVRAEQAADGARPGPGPGSEPPAIEVVEREPVELDRVGTTAVLEVLRLIGSLGDHWTSQPPPVLRSGGVGVRELRRTARDLGVEEAAAATLIEVAYAAGLLNASTGLEPVFLPTGEFDLWRERGTATRWLTLADAWLTMTRQPSLVGARGERDRVVGALSPDVERGTAPGQRRAALDVLAELPPGSSPRARDAVLARLAWHQPRRAAAQAPAATAALAEADLLGVTAAGGLTGYSRTLLAGSPAAAEDALRQALPEPVDHFLVQPDLTVVVPGPPTPQLGLELDLIADLESSGGASVYRITDRSVRRALDAGRSGRTLTAFITQHSRTPVPQSLTYLIDDAARRHGVLRAGTAGAYLRCDDTALLARVLAERATGVLGMRLIAPTVAIATASITDVLATLREAGFAPAAESPDGELITLGTEPPRAGPRPPARVGAGRGAARGDAQLAELVRRVRSGDALSGRDPRVQAVAASVPGVTSAATMEQLRTAVREARLVWFGWAEADGSTTAHTLQPISLAAGTVRGYERGRPGLASYAVHRITAIRLLDEDDPDAAEPGAS
ncbi:helicase-associated domain-containing protein [Jatrophihabitans fulvus]